MLIAFAPPLFLSLSRTFKDAQKAMSKLHDRALRGRKLVVTSASSVSRDLELVMVSIQERLVCVDDEADTRL